MPSRILIVDDEPAIRQTLSAILEDEGYSVDTAESAEEALERVRKFSFELLMLDVWLPGADGLSLLEKLAGIPGAPRIIMISGHASIETAVRATRLGAWDFLEKPLSLERVLLTVQHALSEIRLRHQIDSLREAPRFEEVLLGESEPIRKLRDQIRAAAPTPSRVLISGENGSGKEIIARTLHRESHRSGEPFVAVNCAAIPEELIESELFGHRKGSFTGAIEDRKGKFELADGGTLFLDEVGDMSLSTQAKVLRVLQEQEFQRIGGHRTIRVDVRIVSATNKDLEKEIEAGNFRQDLFFRLNVIPIEAPPLRDRGDDILILARHFLSRFAAETGRAPKTLSQRAQRRLLERTWPGNVRELRNLMERLTILAPSNEIDESLVVDTTQSSPGGIPSDLHLKEAREQFERLYIIERLHEFSGNVSRTAESLGLERSHLYKKLSAYGIEPGTGREE